MFSLTYFLGLFLFLQYIDFLAINEEFLIAISLICFFIMVFFSINKMVKFSIFNQVEFVYFLFFYLLTLNLKYFEKLYFFVLFLELELEVLLPIFIFDYFYNIYLIFRNFLNSFLNNFFYIYLNNFIYFLLLLGSHTLKFIDNSSFLFSVLKNNYLNLISFRSLFIYSLLNILT